MSKYLLFLALLLLIQGSKAQEVEDLPKLPVYVGRSYDLLLGNPLSNMVDPGFQHSIFVFTYKNNEKTEDGKYLIPDSVAHRKVSSCSFATDVRSFRGTTTYQEELKTKASIEGGYKGAAFTAAFSMSTTYEKVEKETTVSNITVTHATAQCQAYELSIDLFKVGVFEPNFIAAVNESYHTANWDKFITQFGTHFVYDITMGGRATQQINYEFHSVSKMESIGIDINMAAKASFAKFFLDTSFDWHKYSEDISYSEKLSQSINELYVGGEPPKDGNIHTWVSQVINNPMPIRYKVMDTSELFAKVPGISINATLATNQFHSSLDKYCARVGCRKPIPDKPKPPPATNSIVNSLALGGTGGSPFTFQHVSTTMNAVKFNIRHGAGIDNLQILLSDGVKNVYTTAQGGQGGSLTEWVVPAGQFIEQIEYRSGDRVDSLTFITNKGVKSPYFGGGGGSYHLVTFPTDYRIIGFYGRSGARLDEVGFILAKTLYPAGYAKPEIDIIRKSLSIE